MVGRCGSHGLGAQWYRGQNMPAGVGQPSVTRDLDTGGCLLRRLRRSRQNVHRHARRHAGAPELFGDAGGAGVGRPHPTACLTIRPNLVSPLSESSRINPVLHPVPSCSFQSHPVVRYIPPSARPFLTAANPRPRSGGPTGCGQWASAERCGANLSNSGAWAVEQKWASPW